jgi:dTDP-4-amino-4,6-dideoxygalactose transaminase
MPRPIPQDPLFVPGALTFRAGMPARARLACFNFFWARNALFHGLRALGMEAGQKVLLPAYLCKAAIEPLDYFGAEVEFYAVGRACEVDWSDVESKVRGNVRAIMAVHYFGIPCEIEKFQSLCRRHGIFLIEDCAHVLEGMANPYRLGEFGDFSIFSPRKYFPIFDGGSLRLNRPSPGFAVRWQFESPLFTVRAAKNILDRRKAQEGLQELEAPAQAPTQPPSEEGPGDLVYGRPGKPRYVFPNDISFRSWMVDFPMSRLSRQLLPHFSVGDIASKRRANYQWLVERLSEFKEVRFLCQQLDADVVPWVLPLTIGEASATHLALRALGIPAVTWGGVRDPRISAGEFPDADFLYERLIFLPIHQDLETDHLETIADVVAKVCRSSR